MLIKTILSNFVNPLKEPISKLALYDWEEVTVDGDKFVIVKLVVSLDKFASKFKLE